MRGEPWGGFLEKGSRTKARHDKQDTKAKRDAHEQNEKGKVRRRDPKCRFPLCGCGKVKRRLEVSHGEHKGAGGNPDGSRSDSRTMVRVCVDRHQDSRVSFHKRTIKTTFYTDAGYNGPVAWYVDVAAMPGQKQGIRQTCWIRVAQEVRPGVLGPLSDLQRQILEELAALKW